MNPKYPNALERMGDNELLEAIRRRDVSITDRLWWMAQASFYERDDVMRAEAKRRNLL